MSHFLAPEKLQSLCHKYGLTPSRRYGQNYLIDEAPIERMLAENLTAGDTVVEIGPGFGVLTLPLAEKVKQVIAYEIEKKLEPYWLEKQKQFSNIEIVWGNVLKEFNCVIARSDTGATWQSPGSREGSLNEANLKPRDRKST